VDALVERVGDGDEVVGGLVESGHDRTWQAFEANDRDHAAASNLSANSAGSPLRRTSSATPSAS
jgi:hypothetical protein